MCYNSRRRSRAGRSRLSFPTLEIGRPPARPIKYVKSANAGDQLIQLSSNSVRASRRVTNFDRSCLFSTMAILDSKHLLSFYSPHNPQNDYTALLSWLPQGEGWLPTWQLIVAVMAVFNTAQNFATIKLTRRIYNTASQPGTSLLCSLLVLCADPCTRPSHASASKDVRYMDTHVSGNTFLRRLQHQRETVSALLGDKPPTSEYRLAFVTLECMI